MATNTKNNIKRKDWVSTFTLVGKAIVRDNSFEIDAQSKKSNWIYNSLNLGIDCGEKYGIIYTSMMGGYDKQRTDNVIRIKGKDEENPDRTDYTKSIVVAWEDRFDEDILATVGNDQFYCVGLEKVAEGENKGKTFYKNFLNTYDAIAYIKEHIVNGMIVRVTGDLNYSEYQGNVQVKKNIKSIVLSSAESENDFKATFRQSILIDKESASLKNIDKDKGIMYVDAKVLDYVKEINGVEYRGNYPYTKTFEFKMDFSNEALTRKTFNALFKVKKGYTQITFEGMFIEGGATVMPTIDDIPDDIKELINIGCYTEEEALKLCATSGKNEKRMVLIKPYIRKRFNDDGTTTTIVQRFEERYADEDLYINIPKMVDSANEVVDKTNLDNIIDSSKSDDKAEDSENDMSWLDEI